MHVYWCFCCWFFGLSVAFSVIIHGLCVCVCAATTQIVYCVYVLNFFFGYLSHMVLQFAFSIFVVFLLSLLQATRARATFFVAISSTVFIFKCREIKALFANCGVFSFSRRKAQKGKAREGTNGAATLNHSRFFNLSEETLLVILLEDLLFWFLVLALFFWYIQISNENCPESR